MSTIDSSTNESALQYAFVLGLVSHLEEFLSEFGGSRGEQDNVEEAIKAQDTCYYIQHSIHFILKKLAIYYKEEDVSRSDSILSLTNALSYNLEYLVLGPKSSSADIGRMTKTQAIIEKIESKSSNPQTQAWLYSERENELAKKFKMMLYSAIDLLRLNGLNDEQNISTFDIASLICGNYFRYTIENLGSIVTLSDASIMKLECVIDTLRSSVKDSTIKIDFETCYSAFKRFLLSYVQISNTDMVCTQDNISLVQKLREHGNNLMSNSSYAQAIAVYTKALDSCSLPSAHNIPQLLTNRSIAFIGLNCFSEAISDLNDAVEYDRTFIPAWTQLGYCHLYMGTSLVALKCYLMALKSSVGGILPEKYVLYKDEKLINDYRESRISSVMPQFISRLVQSIILTERRAFQQRESEIEIKHTVDQIQSILYDLRSRASENDKEYFSYSQNANSQPLRTMVERSGRNHPSILTQDVAQDMIASNGIEASAIAIPAPIATIERITRPRENNEQPSTIRNAAAGIGSILNEFGEIFENGVTTSENDASASQSARNASRVQSPSDQSNNPLGEQNPSAQLNSTDTGNPVRDVLRGFLPDGIAGNLGSIFTNSFNNLPSSTNANIGNNRNSNESNSSGRSGREDTPHPSNRHDDDYMAQDPD